MPQHSPPSGGKWRRALTFHPLIPLSIAAFFLMDIISMVKRPSPSLTGRFTWNNNSVAILHQFHTLPLLDHIFRDVTVGFAPSAFAVDERSWWQMVVFLNDLGVLHLVWLVEGSRVGREGRWWLSPGLWQLLAQLGGGGIIYPLYYFLHLVFITPVAFQQSKAARCVDLNDAVFYLPLVLVFHSVPFAGMYFAPTNEERHWWTWAWQLYTVRISIGYYILKFIRGVVGWPNVQTKRVGDYHHRLKFVLGPMVALSVGMWVYTVVSTPFEFSTIFWPTPLTEGEEGSFVQLIGRMLQFDQWFVMGSSVLWVVCLMWDMRTVGMVSRRQMGWFVALVGLIPLVGPGATFGLMWLVRERCLVGGKGKGGKLI